MVLKDTASHPFFQPPVTLYSSPTSPKSRHAVEEPTSPVNRLSIFTLEPSATHLSNDITEGHATRRWSSFSSSPTNTATLDTVRSSRLDSHLRSASLWWPSSSSLLSRAVAGTVDTPALPPISFTMSLRRKSGVPEPPRIISPSPTPSEHEGSDYVTPRTRTSKRQQSQKQGSQSVVGGPDDHDDDSGVDARTLRRSRTRSRSPIDTHKLTRMTTRSSATSETIPEVPEQTTLATTNGKTKTATATLPATNGHLAPPQPSTGWSWRDFSRSPSPLGLIPIHRHWRTFVHKHEVPRKVLHVSIGFFVVWLYATGTQTTAVPPYLMSGLVVIGGADFLRHRNAAFNRFYVRVLGALMRESEYSGWNGTIFYLLGAWIVLFFLPKDVGAMSVLLLSWCDTAASTFGRLWGRYTIRLRRGKSLAGSLAAFLVGVATSYFFYGWLVPTLGPMPGDDGFMFKGTLSLPQRITDLAGISRAAATISGPLALGLMSLWSGFIASASEVVDIFGWDDNLTIPVLSGIGIWGFLKVFG